MHLIGLYGSPYTRRIAITMRLYGIVHEMQKVLPFGASKAFLRSLNPLGRIPIFVLDSGECLSESHVILDYLDSLVHEAARLTPAAGPDRRKVLGISGLATAATDKLVSTLYEHHFRPGEFVYKPWIAMCDEQVQDAFVWLESQLEGQWLLGDRISQADVTVAVCGQFGREKRPRMFDRLGCTRLQALSDRLEKTQAFLDTVPEGGLPSGLALGTKAET
ncbi:MAG: glutathione S-transferase family protein [Reyranellaceae bacterium]